MNGTKFLSVLGGCVMMAASLLQSQASGSTSNKILTPVALTPVPYAAIDLSANLQQFGCLSVTLMALDDNANVAFGFTNSIDGYGNPNQYDVYTFANGVLTTQTPLTLIQPDGEGGDNYITPLRMLSDGTIYGISTGEYESSLVQAFPSSGEFVSLSPPPPYNLSVLPFQNGNISGPYISAVASDGSLAESFTYEMRSTFQVPVGPGQALWASDLANVITHGNTAQAFANDTYNGTGIPSGINISAAYSGTSINWSENFNPIAINTDGWAVGCGLVQMENGIFHWLNYPASSTESEYEVYSMINYEYNAAVWSSVETGYYDLGAPIVKYFGSQIWDGQTFHSLNGTAGNLINSDIAVSLNNQNQVIVQGYDINGSPFPNQTETGTPFTDWQPDWNATEGYLCEIVPGNLNKTTFSSTLAKDIQKQIRHIQPLLISNQKNPTAGPGYDPSIQIVTQSTNYSANPNGTPENDLFKRDANGKWTPFKIQPYPTTTVISSWVAINSSGLIATIGNTTGNTGVFGQDALLLAPAELAVDANRDGTIVMASDMNNPANFDANGNPLSVDTTSQANPFRFWINDGLDGNGAIDGDPVQESQPIVNTASAASDQSSACDSLGTAVPTSNAGQNKITCTRDLENFARLWMLTRGLNSAIASGQITIGLEWHSNTGDAVNGWGENDGSPGINIYLAAPKHGATSNTGGSDYLTDTNTANDQASGTYATMLGSASRGNPCYLPASAFANLSEANPKTYFLFEGVSRGKGRLVITFNTGTAPYYTKIGEGGGVYMDLKDIKELYERWTVGDNAVLNPQASLLTPYYGGGSPANQATISQDRLSSGISPLQYGASTPGLSVPLDPNGNKYILFVHGYNLQPWEKDTFAETALKRLYWQGFKGKFAAFQWPTTYHLAELGGSVDYDMAEYTAWQAATPLRGLIQKLNASSTGVYVIAHSMGNVVTGEALRLQGPQTLLAGYVASQAAVPVQCYDASQQTPSGFFGTARHPIGKSSIPPVTPVLLTPNIYPNWLGSNQTPAGSLINFYNVNDWALSLVVWQTDEALKPDLFSGIYPPYGYRFGRFTHTPKLGIFQQGFTSYNLTLANSSGLHDQYEIMAFAAQAQCLALGATPNPAGFDSLVDLQQFWGTDPFKNSFKDHVWHSAEFNFSNAEQQAYWENLLGLQGFHLTQ